MHPFARVAAKRTFAKRTFANPAVAIAAHMRVDVAKRLAGLMSALAICAASVRAQDTTGTRLPHVVVKGKIEPGTVSPATDAIAGVRATGAKSEVLHLPKMDANLSEKTARQVFARIPGVFVYDMDGSGNQINIATRGLDPHRSWEMNVRQDGVLVNSDLYGYPASHYSAPLESMERIELVRGTAALQYGSQFGGLLNYATKTPDTTRAANFESINSAGSFGLISTYDAVGGKIGKITYYGYANGRLSSGYRDNAESMFKAFFVRASMPLSRTVNVRAQVGQSAYRYQIPGPLTDAMFAINPEMSSRSRNYYSPNIVVPSVMADWTPSRATKITGTVSSVLGVRNSVQFVGFATAPDTVLTATGLRAPRQVDIDDFRSFTTELRLNHEWTVLGRQHMLSVGVALSNNDMRRRQQGRGTTGDNYDLTIVSGNFGRDLHYRTHNFAAYAEQAIRVTDNWAIIPGVRIESGNTRMTGRLDYYDPANTPRTMEHNFPLFGMRTEFQAPHGVQLYGGFSQAYRPQVLKDVLPETAIERTDTNLKDASGYTAEAGALGTLQNFIPGTSYDISAFALRYDNRYGAIASTDATTGASYIYKTNVGSSMTEGLEVRIEVPVITADRFDMRAFTATAYNHARYRAGTVADAGVNRTLKGNRVEDVPDWITRNGVTASNARGSVTLLGSYVGDSFADALNTETPTANGARGRVPGYALFDINGSFAMLRWMRFGAGVSNIFDKQYFTKRPTFYPGPGVWPSDGRSARISVELQR